MRAIAIERGIDPAFNMAAVDLATQMILDLCGGEASEVVVAGKVPDVSRAYKLDPARVQSWWAWISRKASSARR
jgi:phenylalanyl-tRNA synthetase beta chain